MATFAKLQDHFGFSAEKMVKSNVFDSPNMFCDVYCFEPGQAQKPHTHSGSDKIYYVIEGTADVQIGEETRRLSPGELAHAAPGAAHGVVNPGPGRLTVLVFMTPKP